MDDHLIDDDRLSLARKSLVPGTGFFYPDSLAEARAEERTREAVTGAEAVVVADGDADGLACAALVRAARDAAVDEAAVAAAVARHDPETDAGDDGADVAADVAAEGDGEATEAADAHGSLTDADAVEPEVRVATLGADSPVAFVGAGPGSLPEALERVAASLDPGAEVFVCDLCPDDYADVGAPLEALAERAGSVRWFDHHQWDDDVARAVREAGVDLVVGDSEAECSADVTLRSLGHEFGERFRDLAAATRDHDLWIQEDPRSDDLADFAYWSDAEEYIAVVGAYGADLPAPVRAYLERRREEKRALVERAAERAEVREVGPWTVGVTYGRCSQNEVAEALRERGTDAAVIVKPAGSASIRGTETFERAHEVAGLVGGGGHPKAAGCKPDIYDDMLDYAYHWTTRGEACRRVILAAFERVAERAAEPADDPDGEPAGSDPGVDERTRDGPAADERTEEGVETGR